MEVRWHRTCRFKPNIDQRCCDLPELKTSLVLQLATIRRSQEWIRGSGGGVQFWLDRDPAARLYPGRTQDRLCHRDESRGIHYGSRGPSAIARRPHVVSQNVPTPLSTLRLEPLLLRFPPSPYISPLRIRVRGKI